MSYDNSGYVAFTGACMAAAGAAFVALLSATTVKPGEVGVKIVFGEAQEVLDEGLHFVLPFATKIERVDVRQQSLVMTGMGGSSSEGQNIFSSVQVNYSVVPDSAVSFYRKYSTIERFQSTFLSNSAATTTKNVLVRRPLSETISQREQVANDVQLALKEEFMKFDDIVVSSVQLTDIDFSDSVVAALEQKEVAQQAAKQAEFKLQEAKKLAEAEVAKAEGQAEAQKLLAESLRQDGGELSLKRQELENQAAFIQAWQQSGGQVPQVLNIGGADGSSVILDLPK